MENEGHVPSYHYSSSQWVLHGSKSNSSMVLIYETLVVIKVKQIKGGNNEDAVLNHPITP